MAMQTVAKETVQLNFAILQELDEEIDRFQKRYPILFGSKAAAARWLLAWALSQNPQPLPRDQRDE
jgi:hypothetical protein